jgi:hypothetical protein
VRCQRRETVQSAPPSAFADHCAPPVRCYRFCATVRSPLRSSCPYPRASYLFPCPMLIERRGPIFPQGAAPGGCWSYLDSAGEPYSDRSPAQTPPPRRGRANGSRAPVRSLGIDELAHGTLILGRANESAVLPQPFLRLVLRRLPPRPQARDHTAVACCCRPSHPTTRRKPLAAMGPPRRWPSSF